MNKVQNNQMVNATLYIEQINRIKEAIQLKWPYSVISQYDNARR